MSESSTAAVTGAAGSKHEAAGDATENKAASVASDIGVKVSSAVTVGSETRIQSKVKKSFHLPLTI